jgi:ABC-2 type transport system ATP-binding protein
MKLALEVDHVSKKYGKSVALDDISFSIKEGSFFGFLGPNGAGKSTTIHLTTGIARLTEGNIRIFGKDVVSDYREARRLVGLSPQEFNIDMFEKVDKVLDFVGGYYGMRKQERRDRIEELLERFQLQEHRHKEFRMLSGGLKRRVVIARAMMHNPKLLILDEPTAGVDVELRHEIWRYLADLNKAGTTILLTSHYLDEVEKLCDTIAFVNHGKLIEIGKKSDYVGKGRTLEKKYLEITGRPKGESK